MEWSVVVSKKSNESFLNKGEMPSPSWPLIKCEPSSEEENSNSQFIPSYACNPVKNLPDEPLSVKLEHLTRKEDNVSSSASHILHQLQVGGSTLEELAAVSPAGPAATPVCVKIEPQEPTGTQHTLETLHSTSTSHEAGSTIIDRHISLLSSGDVPDSTEFVPLMPIKDEPLSEGEQQTQSGDETSDSSQLEAPTRGSPKSWTQKDMDNALEALRTQNMSLTKASATYGIPSTTLWQRAHRLGIDTPKKEGSAKSWGEDDLRRALHALRAGAISANKASKAYGIPSSTLYKIARREGIRLAAPFNAAPTAWRRADLERALDSIRCGASSVQRAATQFGIPTGTLYGRCKREGIELSRSNPTPWSEDAMGEALEAVRVGQMSINQAAIHFNLPYSSLYGRFKRCKYQIQSPTPLQPELQNSNEADQQQQNFSQYYHHPVPSHTVHHLPEPHTMQEDGTVLQENHPMYDRKNMLDDRITYSERNVGDSVHGVHTNGGHNMQLHYTQHIGSEYMDQYGHTNHSNQMYYSQSCNMAS